MEWNRGGTTVAAAVQSVTFHQHHRWHSTASKNDANKNCIVAVDFKKLNGFVSRLSAEGVDEHQTETEGVILL